MRNLKSVLLAVVASLVVAGVAYASTVALTAEQVSKSGTIATYTSVALANTYTVANDGRTMLHFKKSGAGDCVITVVTPGTIQGMAVADLTVTVPATTGDKFVGPFPMSLFNDANGLLQFTASDTAGLTVAVLRL